MLLLESISLSLLAFQEQEQEQDLSEPLSGVPAELSDAAESSEDLSDEDTEVSFTPLTKSKFTKFLKAADHLLAPQHPLRTFELAALFRDHAASALGTQVPGMEDHLEYEDADETVLAGLLSEVLGKTLISFNSPSRLAHLDQAQTTVQLTETQVPLRLFAVFGSECGHHQSVQSESWAHAGWLYQLREICRWYLDKCDEDALLEDAGTDAGHACSLSMCTCLWYYTHTRLWLECGGIFSYLC